MRAVGVIALAVACAPAEAERPAPARGAEVVTNEVVEVASVPAAVEVAVPVLPRSWSAPKLQDELAAVEGGAGVVGRWSESPETIVRVDARTGAEQWRVAQPDGVMWLRVRVGATHAAITGRLPAHRGDRIGWIDVETGALLWSRALAERTEAVIGGDGTGVGLVRGCALEVLDPATGRTLGEVRGRTMTIGHAGVGGPGYEDLCGTPPTLLGWTGTCGVVLAPTGAADMTIVGVGPAGRCRSVALGRVDDRVAVAGEVVSWHAHATLHVAGLERAAGRLRWRRTFAGKDCWPTAHAAPDGAGGAMTLVHACDRAVALGADGAPRWTVAVAADAVVVVGEDDRVARLEDSPGVRALQFVTTDGQLGGRVVVPDLAAAYAVGVGVIVEDGAALTLWDAQGREVWTRAAGRGRWSAIGGYVLIKEAHPGGTVIVEAGSGRAIGRDPYAAEPLAVLPAAKRVVMRAGYLWARALP